jgi:hypothetical protein
MKLQPQSHCGPNIDPEFGLSYFHYGIHFHHTTIVLFSPNFSKNWGRDKYISRQNFIGKPKWKKLIGGYGSRWEDNIKTNLGKENVA